MEIDPLGTEIYSAAELADAIGDRLRAGFPDTIMVQGEVSDLKRSQPGHVYFNLVEPAPPGKANAASLPVALFTSNKKTVNALLKRAGVGRIQDGMPLRIRTTVDFYAARGTLTLAMSGVDPTYTLDALTTQREMLLKQLLDEGLDKKNAEHPLPPAPQRIGLITSIGSAAYADFTEELGRSGYHWEIVAMDTRVQGVDAERGLVEALRTITLNHDVELVVMIRGGGSRGDLAAFDSEELARTIARCPVPVLTGIGHEIDTSIADVLSHSNYKTPTACAVALNEIVNADLLEAEDRWQTIQQLVEKGLRQADENLANQVSLWRSLTGQLIQAEQVSLNGLAVALSSRCGHQLETQARRLETTSGWLVGQARHATSRSDQQVTHSEAALTRSSSRTLDSALRIVDNIESRVRSLDPSRTLARGWSITRTLDGDLVLSASQAEPDAQLVTTTADGDILSRVEPEPTG